MNFTRTFLSLGIALLSYQSAAYAELYECDGKWTNKPCNGDVTRSIEESGSAAPADEATKALREKTSLLHDLRMKEIKAREQYDIQYDISSVEKFCLSQESSIEDCSKRIESARTALDKRIATEGSLAAQRRANQLQDEANKLQEQRNTIEAEKPNVAIVENRRIIVVPRDWDHGHGHHDNGGASIHVQGSGSSGNISVGGSISAGSGSHGGGHDGRGHHAPIIINPANRPRQSSVTVYDNFGNPKKLDGVEPGPFAPKKPAGSEHRR